MGGRGKKHLKEERLFLLQLIDEAVDAGARQFKACELIGVSERCIQRWREQDGGEDQRKGPKSSPANKLTQEERATILEVVNSPEYRDLSPKQIVPQLADDGKYIGSESSIYRTLREEGQMKHRQKSHPATHSKPKGLVATGPNQAWSWDITYLLTTIKGQFFYLYLFIDIWSRKIVAWEVYDCESMEYSSLLVSAAYEQEQVKPGEVTLHSDNGGPMKGSTMRATLEALGVAPSFSRPSVSNDNPYSESLFRTLKYRPDYPSKPFDSLESARAWVGEFVYWYNHIHLHSSISFVTPVQRHNLEAEVVLEKRREVYEQARQANPARWSRGCRKWEQPKEVYLNYLKKEQEKKEFKTNKMAEVPSPSASSSSLTQKRGGAMVGRRDSPSPEARV